MASNAKSRWADSAEDAALDAKLKREKEEKKRLKAEKARKAAEAERLAQQARAAKSSNGTENDGDANDSTRPAKRRKFTPDAEERTTTANGDGGAPSDAKEGTAKLMRFPVGHWGKCRSVENYDKLNDIEEGTYGWVSRAKEASSGKVVALKRLKIEPSDRNGLPVTGLREIQILRDCSHRNIVHLEEVVVGDDTSKIEKYVTYTSISLLS